MVIPCHSMSMQGVYYLFHWMKVKCNQVVVQGEILANNSMSNVNIGCTILIKAKKLATHMHLWLKYWLHNFKPWACKSPCNLVDFLATRFNALVGTQVLM